MLVKEKIRKLQEMLMNVWPANHYYFLNGWILRFTSGVTARANSVFPLYYNGNLNTLDEDIKFVEKAYNAFKLPAIFTIPDYFEPNNLDVKLLEQGYHQSGCLTYTMMASIEKLKNEEINEEFTYLFHSERINKYSEFLAKYSQRNQDAQKILEALSKRIIIPQKQFIIVEYKNKIIGTLTGILDPYGFLYIVDVLVHPDFRRQKVATSMFFNIIDKWGIPNETKTIWLQVETENKAALNFYSNIGLKRAYTYYYLEKNLV